jgi:hypothetical protein
MSSYSQLTTQKATNIQNLNYHPSGISNCFMAASFVRYITITHTTTAPPPFFSTENKGESTTLRQPFSVKLG